MEVIITVGQTHWRCVTCKLLNRRVVSIDRHVRSVHADILQSSEDRDGTFCQDKADSVAGVQTGALANTDCLSNHCLPDAENVQSCFGCPAGTGTAGEQNGKFGDSMQKEDTDVENAKNHISEKKIARKTKISRSKTIPAVVKTKSGAKVADTLSKKSHRKSNKVNSVVSGIKKTKLDVDTTVSKSAESHLPGTDDVLLATKCFKPCVEHLSDPENDSFLNEDLHSICATTSSRNREPQAEVKQRKTAKKRTLPHGEKVENLQTTPGDEPKILRPGRKAVQRKDLLDGEKRYIREKYLMSVVGDSGIKDSVIAFAEQNEPLPEKSVSIDRGASALEADSIMQDLHFLSSLSSPLPPAMHDRKETSLQNTTEISSDSEQLCQQANNQCFSKVVDFTSRQYSSTLQLHETRERDTGVAGVIESDILSEKDIDSQICDLHVSADRPGEHKHLSTPDNIQISEVFQKENGSCQSWEETASVGAKTAGPSNCAVSLDSLQIFQCSICQAKFSSLGNLSFHEAQMASLEVTQCKECEKKFHGGHNLNLHVFGEHELNKKSFCFTCGKVFVSMEKLEMHVYTHVSDRTLRLAELKFHECRICSREILSEYSVMQSHYYARHKAILCFDCYIKSHLVYFSDSAAAQEHRESHLNICSLCSEKFPSREMLLDHYLVCANGQVEEDGEGMKCEKCSQWCPSRMLVTLHDKWHKLQRKKDKHAQDAQVGFACLHCDKVFTCKRNLVRHRLQGHSKRRDFRFHCEFCGKGEDTKGRLQDHIAMHHLGVKRYSCSFCDKRFVCRPTLRRHVFQEHSRDKGHSCEICGEHFCEKIKLEKHMFKHTGRARFMCEQCGKSFHTKYEFNNHKSVHAETRDFVCGGCGQDYKRKFHLQRHVKNCRKAVQTFVASADSL